jgi:hypothetical protein
MTPALTMWLAADSGPAVADTGGLSQPSATVMAALIAVIGAVVAFLGVTVTTRTTRSENRRAEKATVLTDAWAAVFKLSRALERVNKISNPTVRAERIKTMAAGPVGDLGDDHAITASKLTLYNFGAAAHAITKLNAELTTLWETIRDNPTTTADDAKATQAYKSAHQAIKDAIDGLS